jgi:RHS repeat-associated protein
LALSETLLIPSAIPSGTYLETGGLVVAEAENYTNLADTATHAWLTETVLSGYEGESYLHALPDIDLFVQPDALDDSPTAVYPIRFTTPGTYTVWSRAYADNADADAMYVGLNGEVTNLTGFAPEEWTWANRQIPSGDPATLSIETSGIYTLSTMMYEDGLRLDRLLLTTDTTYLPTGSGPIETARQTGAASSATTLTRTIVYTYDHLYRLTEADYSTGEFFAYAYDPMGNQTAITETIASTIVTTYTYNTANQLATARADDDGIVWHYTHDANGNLLRQTPSGTAPADGETRYTYNAANQLVQVELYSGGSYVLLSEATYNGNGERMSLTTYALSVPQTVTYVVAQGQLLVADDGSEETFYLHGHGLIAEYAGAWSYPLNDGTGSLRQTVDEGGTVTLARSYQPFGSILQEEGTYETIFGYMGGQLDRLSGLLYANGRYYDPSTGRYLTPDRSFDPLRPSTLNPYAPLQGPALWLFAPLIGIILLRRRGKGGPWRILMLVCVIGLGLSLVSCGGGGEGTPVPGATPGPTPVPTLVVPPSPTQPEPPTQPSTPPTTPEEPPTQQTPESPPSSPTSTSTASPSPTLIRVIPCPTPTTDPWESLGPYYITVYYHSSAQLWIDKNSAGELIDVQIDIDGTTDDVTVQVKSSWLANVQFQGVAGWVEKSVFEASNQSTQNITWLPQADGSQTGDGIFVKCPKGGTSCYQVSKKEARTSGGTRDIHPYKTVAFNLARNKSLEFGDIVRIEGIDRDVVVEDAGGGPPKNGPDLPQDAWLDYYLGIQNEDEWGLYDLGTREVKVKR